MPASPRYTRREAARAAPKEPTAPIRKSWHEAFEQFRDFRLTNGHFDIPSSYVSADGFPLGKWAVIERSKAAKNTMPADRLALMQSAGEGWNKQRPDWEHGFKYLLAFHAAHGHSDVPTRYTAPDGFKLGPWVSGQRTSIRRNQCSPERLAKLQAVGMVTNKHRQAWADACARLEAYVKVHGNANVQRDEKSDDGFCLGMWVSDQRQQHHRGVLSDLQVRQLQKLGMIWSIHDRNWEQDFKRLKAFVRKHGHPVVPKTRNTCDWSELATWLDRQKKLMRKGELQPERKSRLDSLGPWWQTCAKTWRDHLNALTDFAEREGHCDVPEKFVTESGLRLGIWLRAQRRLAQEGQLEAFRLKRLAALGVRCEP